MVAPLSAHAFSLQWPVACTDGVDCVVQNYVDHPQGDAARDFSCGSLTYPKHDGTDIRLKNLAAMRAGVAVLAPADGTVLRVRDGVADQSIRQPGDTDADVKHRIAELNNTDCGNGIVIQHAEGYQTQLCHLRRGSIRVRPGQTVAVGDIIGMVGLSGNTEFPHLHITVRWDGQVIDPFNATPMQSACGDTSAEIWLPSHPYRATMLLGDGFYDGVPDRAAMEDTPIARTALDASAPALTYWAEVLGIQAGDVLTLRITQPDGKVYAEHSTPFTTAKAVYYSFIGKRNRTPLMAGDYKAQVTLMRAGSSEPVMEFSRTVTVR